MAPAEVLDVVRRAGVSLRAEEGRLIASPKNSVTPELRKMLQENKATLLKCLSGTDVADVALPEGDGGDYTEADLAQMDRLIGELCELEGRDDTERRALQDERRRMAPVNVLRALAALRIARDQALAIWPDRHTKRARITLCELTARPKEFAVVEGKGHPRQQAKRLNSGKEAA